MAAQSSAASGRSRRSWVYAGIALLFGMALGIVVAEVALRTSRWTPPMQIVRGNGLHLVDGVPVWEQATDRYNRDCAAQHPERTRVLFFGSSITFGVGLTAQETFTSALQDRLNQRAPVPGFCVLNFAQPGFGFHQKYAVARAEVARYRPALIMWEDWVEWAQYRMIGDAAYGIGDLRVRADGFVGIAGVPDVLNRWSFLHSRLYQYLSLGFGERTPDRSSLPGVMPFIQTHLAKVPRLAGSVGAKLVFYPAPPLDRPFAETAQNLPDWHAALLQFAGQQQVPIYPLQRELIGADYREVRLDPCCHFNAAGHRALVPVMERIILTELGQRQWLLRNP